MKRGRAGESRAPAAPWAPQQVIVDPAMVREREPARELPSVWTSDLVGERLIEAARTIRRMPMQTRPREFGTVWPHFEPMTAAEQAQLLNELQQDGQLADWQRERNRVRIQPGSDEIARAEEALHWPARYLREDRHLAGVVTFWADRANDVDEIPVPVRQGLREIARGLRRDRVPVR